MKVQSLPVLILCIVLFGFGANALVTTAFNRADSKSVWLFTSFRGNGEDGLHLAYSRDGYQWIALKKDQS
ncbi:MAG: glycosyl hydrolase, partial [Blastocatellia bacterium]